MTHLRNDNFWYEHSPWAEKGNKRNLWNENIIWEACNYLNNEQGDDLPGKVMIYLALTGVRRTQSLSLPVLTRGKNPVAVDLTRIDPLTEPGQNPER